MHDDAKVAAARRKFLKSAGKFAIYTPPAVMLLMKPSYATISKSIAGRPEVEHGNGTPPSSDPRGVR